MSQELFKTIFKISCNHYKNTASGSSRRPLGKLCYLQHNNNPYFTFKKLDCSDLFSIFPLDPCSIFLDPVISFGRLSMEHIIQAPLSCDFPLGLASWRCWQKIKDEERAHLGYMFIPSFYLWTGSDRGLPICENRFCVGAPLVWSLNLARLQFHT